MTLLLPEHGGGAFDETLSTVAACNFCARRWSVLSKRVTDEALLRSGPTRGRFK